MDSEVGRVILLGEAAAPFHASAPEQEQCRDTPLSTYTSQEAWGPTQKGETVWAGSLGPHAEERNDGGTAGRKTT